MGVPIKIPLASLTYTRPTRFSAGLEKILADEMNVKQIFWVKGDTLKVEFDPNLTPELLEEGRQRAEKRELMKLRKKLGLKPSDPLPEGEEIPKVSLKDLLKA